MQKFKRLVKKPAVIITICVCLTVLFFAAPGADAASASTAAEQINAINGLNAAVSGDTINVTGTALIGAASRLDLELDANVTVNWYANLTGAATANNYLITLRGSGTFNMIGGTITNGSGAGGTVYIAGQVVLNVTGGTIDSPGSGSAVTVNAGTLGAVINVNGGTIKSTPSGYAINDGAGMSASPNNTKINVISGRVEAGNACAIRSTGISSVVTVSGGDVLNNAASNSNPVIYMNYAPPPNPGIYNIIISGGTVRTTNTDSNTSYVVQTSQNVRVTGGTIRAFAGRAINLVGTNSIAEVTGGRVTTQTGIAISTATTTLDDITNAKVIISGGIVEATGVDNDFSGTAVKITGYNSTVSVSGNAVVTAKAGMTIDASGRPAGNCITITGGFVFGWGNAVNKVAGPSGKLTLPVTSGVIAAWNTTTGTGTYNQGADTDLAVLPAGAAPGSVYWDNGASLDGITYNGRFFGITGVKVITTRFALTVTEGTITAVNGVGITPVSSKNDLRAGDVVTIKARDDKMPDTSLPPPTHPTNGDAFGSWTTADNSIITEISSAQTTLTMPGNDVTVTANFIPRYRLHVTQGEIHPNQRNFSGSLNYGYYPQGAIITITGLSTFHGWNYGDTQFVAEPAALITTFTMPGKDAYISSESAYTAIPPIPPRTVTVINGYITSTTGGVSPPANSTSYTCYRGTGLIIEANPPAGEVFYYWKITVGTNGTFADDRSANTVFTMLDYDDMTIEAVCGLQLYTLTVIDGTGSGTYAQGAAVDISAPNLPHMNFSWHIDIGAGDFAAINANPTVFYMPDCDTVISPHYENIGYVLTVIDGKTVSGLSVFNHGEVVNITATPPEGNIFTRWTSDNGGEFASSSSASTQFIMPENDVTITANNLTPVKSNKTYTLTVINNIDNSVISVISDIKAGESVNISTPDIMGNHIFTSWIVDGSGYPLGNFADAHAHDTSFTMPPADRTVRALYTFVPTPETLPPIIEEPEPEPEPEPEQKTKTEDNYTPAPTPWK